MHATVTKLVESASQRYKEHAADIGRAKELNDQHKILQREVETAQQHLTNADGKRDAFRRLLDELRVKQAKAWTFPQLHPSSYDDLIATEYSLNDYESRVRKVLLDELNAAQMDLKEFEKQLSK